MGVRRTDNRKSPKKALEATMILAFAVGLIMTCNVLPTLLWGRKAYKLPSQKTGILKKFTPDHVEQNHVKSRLFNLYWIANWRAGTFVLIDSLSGEFPSSLPFDHTLIYWTPRADLYTCQCTLRARRGGGFPSVLLVGVCHPVHQSHTLSQTKKCNFAHHIRF